MPEYPPDAPLLHEALVRHTGYLISRMGVHASRHFADKMEGLGLTTRMWGLLNVLDSEGPVSQHQLGRALAIDPSSMVGAIDALESRGLVERRPHPSDRRANALHMTAAGRRLLKRGRMVAGQAQEELLGPLDQTERAQLHALLLRLAEHAQDGQDPK